MLEKYLFKTFFKYDFIKDLIPFVQQSRLATLNLELVKRAKQRHTQVVTEGEKK